MTVGDQVRYYVRGEAVVREVIEVGDDYFVYACDGERTDADSTVSSEIGYATAPLSSVGTDYELVV